MKIVLIHDNNQKIGGAEEYFFDLKARLMEVAHCQVYTITFDRNATKPGHSQHELILKQTRNAFTKLWWQICFHPFIYFKLKTFLKKIKPDRVHLHNNRQYSISVLSAIRGYNVIQTVHDYALLCPVSYNIHKNQKPCETGFQLACFWQHRVRFNIFIYSFLALSYLIIKYKTKKTIKCFLASTPLLAEYLKKQNFENIIHLPLFKKDHHSYSASKIKPHHFLFVGKLGQHKGVHLLLREFQFACTKNPKLILKIAGTHMPQPKYWEK